MAGYISYFNLDEWFTTSFTKSEQQFMENCYLSNCVGNSEGLYSGAQVSYCNKSLPDFLSNLILFFNKKDLYDLCLKIVKKTEEIILDSDFIEDKHFYYMHLIEFYYKNRDIDDNLNKAIYYCNKQISIANDVANFFRSDSNWNYLENLPSHLGYKQLTIIEKKNKNWGKVIELSLLAKKQGWSGDWDKRIEEAKRKLS